MPVRIRLIAFAYTSILIIASIIVRVIIGVTDSHFCQLLGSKKSIHALFIFFQCTRTRT